MIELAREFEARGEALGVRALRIDSGNLAAEGRTARARLDAAGLERIELFASGGLDEWDVEAFVAQDAPYAGFGVGTRVVTSADTPHGDAVYKLVALDGEGRIKLSPDKATIPGAKQILRHFDADGVAAGDVLTTADDRSVPGDPLLIEVMRDGRRTPEAAAATNLETARQRAAVELARLPRPLCALELAAVPYPVAVSPVLRREFDRTAARVGGGPTAPR